MDDPLARITVHTPYRRLDVALPDRPPVAELLPELLRYAGAPPADQPGGWVLRRTGGEILAPARGLGDQRVRDGDVLHLVPERLAWPEPVFDDPVAEAALVARERGGQWDIRTTRAAACAAGGLLLAAGLAVVVLRPSAVAAAVPAAAAVGLLAVAAVVPRRDGDRLAGTLLGVAALPYAFAAGAAWAAGGRPVPAGAASLLLASLAGLAWCRHAGGRHGGAVPAAGYVAGATVAVVGGPVALAGEAWGAAGAAAALASLLVCGFAALPRVAVRLAGLPPPPSPGPVAGGLSGAPAAAGPGGVRPAVARAQDMLTGALAGWSVLAVAAAGVLVSAGGPAGRALAAATATALLLRARVFPAVGHRVAVLAGGLAGWAVVGGWLIAAAPDTVLPAVVVVAVAAAAAAAVTGPVAGWRPAPLLGRLADLADLLAVLAVVPLAAGVLGLYGEVVQLMTAW